MPIRKPMSASTAYHIFNKSIAGFQIFQSQEDYQRFIWIMQFYTLCETNISFSHLMLDHAHRVPEKMEELSLLQNKEAPFQWIAYCLMPTHFHFVIYQKEANAISALMKKIQSSYALYFNLKHNRQGPLWSSRFKHVACTSDEQLLHLTRYVHLNPVTAYLVNKPEEWFATSFHEYIHTKEKKLCHIAQFISMTSKNYENFVNDRIDEQRARSKIKSLMLD